LYSLRKFGVKRGVTIELLAAGLASRSGGLVSVLVPLFPLDLVLFPGAPQPLHIFELRYKEMIGECLAEKKVFGIVRAEENKIAEIGTTAEIIAVTKTYDDGRMDIVTEGRERFEVMELNEERSFLQGQVNYFEDAPELRSSGDAARLISLHNEILTLVGAAPATPEADDPHLTFSLAASLPLDLDFKQTLLGLRSETERTAALLKYYEAMVPKLHRAVTVRKRAGGNGHGG
jgi:Lon protease-like protein